MITYKEIKRRFNSADSKDVSWVVHTCLKFMIGVGLVIAASLLFI